MAERIVDEPCFGFFWNGSPCDTCQARARCKAITVTDGLTILGSLTNHLTEQLPEGDYVDTDKVTELVAQLMSGPTKLKMSAEEERLLGLVKSTKTDGLSVKDI